MTLAVYPLLETLSASSATSFLVAASRSARQGSFSGSTTSATSFFGFFLPWRRRKKATGTPVQAKEPSTRRSYETAA